MPDKPSIRKYELHYRRSSQTTPPISSHDHLFEAMQAAHADLGLQHPKPLFTDKGFGLWISTLYIIHRIPEVEEPASDYSLLADEIMHPSNPIPKPPNTVEVLYDILSRIQALCENPHWTPERKTRIAELAAKGRKLLEDGA